jgi:hypothetical protein
MKVLCDDENKGEMLYCSEIMIQDDWIIFLLIDIRLIQVMNVMDCSFLRETLPKFW